MRTSDNSKPILYLVHDPMCSWCYAFAPAWRRIVAALPRSVATQYVLGGLAPDTDQPMPLATRTFIENTWRRIQVAVPGSEFNFEYWKCCEPRRSTYPACRAVLAAKYLDPDKETQMFARVQAAYYRQARNPSDLDTLRELAGEIGLDTAAFSARLASADCQAELEEHVRLARTLGVRGFPSLVLTMDSRIVPIALDYNDPCVTLDALEQFLNRG